MLLKYKKKDGSVAQLRLKTISHSKPVTIGRDQTASISLEDGECSRIHCAIRYWDDMFVIRDMNSRNGTFVNGQQIEVARLNPDDVIRVGATVIKAEAEEGQRSDVTQVERRPPV